MDAGVTRTEEVAVVWEALMLALGYVEWIPRRYLGPG
jgi:hypothetical protein